MAMHPISAMANDAIRQRERELRRSVERKRWTRIPCPKHR